MSFATLAKPAKSATPVAHFSFPGTFTYPPGCTVMRDFARSSRGRGAVTGCAIFDIDLPRNPGVVLRPFAAARALPESPVTDSIVVLPSINMSADSENDFVVSPALLLRGSRAAHGKRHALRAMVTARDQIDTLRP